MGSDKSKKHGYTVSYNSESHFEVITQSWGSVWPLVFPYCLFNTLLSVLLDWLKFRKGIDLGISSQGHSYMGLVVAFLIVSRVNVSIGRYTEARGYLSTMFRTNTELTQDMVVLTYHNVSDAAKEWRYDVAYRAMLLLRCVVAVISYQDSKVPCWELPEMNEEEAAKLKDSIYLGGGQVMNYAHGPRSEDEENMRVPVIMSYKLRKTIHSQRLRLDPNLETAQENKLLASVDGFMNGYYGMRKFLTTPFPFPLVQMTRTFLFTYVFTVPFALLSVNEKPIFHYILIFFFTFGFMGLEVRHAW